MNKELFVSSTPHETKVGMVEDDLLAEVYLERENEYTLAGSIYKGRVTRVLPGMQSAFVDIGLERDAFLYVSDFMELEEHDDDLTDVIPAGRGVQDLRQPAPVESALVTAPVAESEAVVENEPTPEAEQDFSAEGPPIEGRPTGSTTDLPEPVGSGEFQNRDRGGWRGRRRRRGGRRDGRSERGFDRNGDRDRSSDPRFARPADSAFSHTPAGPAPAYEPILLPGESISKYQRRPQPGSATEVLPVEPAREIAAEAPTEFEKTIATTFPDDEPIFAEEQAATEPLHEQHEDVRPTIEEPVESASTTTAWNREFGHSEAASASSSAWVEGSVSPVSTDPEHIAPPERISEPARDEAAHEEGAESDDRMMAVSGRSDYPAPSFREDQAPAFAAPGTMEEETIDEDEAETIHYHASSDDSYDEFEEETQNAGQPYHLNGDARAAVSEIHMASLAESGEVQTPEGISPESEDDSDELELEEAQAQAEAMLDAEARGDGTVDARAEVRAPSATAGYTQRTQRSRYDRGYDRRGGDRGRRGGGRRFRRRESAPVPLISDLLKEGQEILVQIAKEPIGKKGARITSHIALPGRFLVYMPTVNHTGVSRKISSEEERQRLKRIILSERENGHGGFIVRTAAQSASEEELRADIRFLKGLWQDIKNRAESSKPPALIYHDLNVVERVLRDQVTSDFSVIWVDTEAEYERILRFFNRFQPGMVKRVKLYTKETPLFEQFGLTEEMNKALKSKVWLKSGGYIVINQTEALVAIDINTGKYVGKTQRLEDTIVKTNIDAIKEIVRQIRLRDLGGIIIIDFIDMDERRNRQRVMQALEEELRLDRAPSKTLQFNDFGLVAITRKRVKQSLERTIGAPCPYCQATGYVKSVTTICNEIYVEMRKIAKHLEHEDVMLRVHPDVAKELKSNNGRLLNEMEELTKRTIIVKSDPAVHQEQFDIN